MTKPKTHPISELTIKIENKYGSVIKCPDDDPMMIKLHELTSKTIDVANRNNALMRKIKSTGITNKNRAHSLAMQGYSDTEIAKKLNLSRSTVRHWLTHLKNRPAKFTKVVVAKSTGNRIYFPTSKDIKEWCKQVDHQFLSINRGDDKVFSIQQIKVHWHELPVGAVYRSAQQNQFFIKENDDSYARGEQYYF